MSQHTDKVFEELRHSSGFKQHIKDTLFNNMADWQYDKDNDHMMCRCPDCAGRLLIGAYDYTNPYKFCPYCGLKLGQGQFDKAHKRIYGADDE